MVQIISIKQIFPVSLTWLSLAFFFMSCSQQKANGQQHIISTIISSDSVIIYSGKLSKTTPFEYIPLEEKKVKEILIRLKNAADSPAVVLLKVRSVGGGFMDNVANVQSWAEQIGITDWEKVDGDAMDMAIFHADTGTWRFIHEMLAKPSSLQLNMPRDERATETTENADPATVRTIILLSQDSVYIYAGKELQKGKIYELKKGNSVRQYLADQKKRVGDKLLVLIKPATRANYQLTVDILDEMTINKIKEYAMVKMNDAEALLFNEPFEPIKVVPGVSTTTKKSITTSSFFILLKNDNTIMYKTDSADLMVAYTPLTKNDSTTLSNAISAYIISRKNKPQHFLIIGEPKSKYEPFELIINTLKKNNIYKYDLLTTETELKPINH